MKTLTLMRHAKSSWNSQGLADHERPLNARGERDAPKMARRLRDAGIRPSLIVSSTAVRAWTTAKTIAKVISYPVEFLQRTKQLYLASLDTLIEVIETQDVGFNDILVVAHNPGLTDLANHLHPGLTDNLPTSSIVSVSIDSDTWDLQDRNKITLDVYDYPKNIP